MIEQSMVDRLPGCQVIDRGGEKIGAVSQVWVDSRSGRPAWASVQSGLFGLKETFVPLQRAELHDGHMTVPVSKDQVKAAPRIDAAGDQISDAEQVALCRHYGLPGSGESPSDRDASSGRVWVPTAGGGDAMTRSEEHLTVGRLVRHVATEREPVTGADRDAALPGPERQVRLRAEKSFVYKEIVPEERVRMPRDTVPENETMSGQVRQEQVADGQLFQHPDRRARPPRNP